MESKKISRLGIIVVSAVIVIAILYILRNALLPVFVSMFLAYLLNPLIVRMEKRKIKRRTAIFILGTLSFIVIGAIGVSLLIQAQQEFVQLYHNLPEYLEKVRTKTEPTLREYLGIEFPKTLDEMFVEAKNQLSQVDPSVLKPLPKIIAKITSKTVALIGWLAGLIIIPVFLYYFLRDFELIKNRAIEYIPIAYRDYLVDKFKKIDEALGSFIRGQLTVCAILGLLYSIGLLIVGIDMAVVIGIVSGLGFIVPYLGTFIGILAGSIMCLLQYGLSYHLLGVWAVFAIVQAFEGTLITPRIVGKRVGMNPVIVIFSLLVGADLLGFLGLLVAVPIAAVLKVFISDALERYRKSKFFTENSSETK